MQVGLLGPVYVACDGAQPSLTPAQRALMAVLAISNTKVVSSHLLITAIWHELPSPERLRNLRFHICKLRAILCKAEPGRSASRIMTAPDGYKLTLCEGELDSDDFKRLLWRARESARRGDTGPALQDYHDALALWRGPALASTAAQSPWLSAEAAGLDELHATAYEEATDIALAAGRQHDVLASLITMAAHHPARDRLTRQLMIALHRSGRQAEALNAYSAYRESLRENFGLDPSSPMQRLHQLILDGDSLTEEIHQLRPGPSGQPGGVSR